MPRRMLFIVAFTVPDTDTTEPEDVVAMLTDLTKNSLDPMAPENQHITIEVYEVHES